MLFVNVDFKKCPTAILWKRQCQKIRAFWQGTLLKSFNKYILLLSKFKDIPNLQRCAMSCLS